MKKKVLKAERTPEDFTRLSWEDDSGCKGTDEYLFTSGAVVWPHEMLPGIILMAGRDKKRQKVLVFEESEFQSLSEAINIFGELWDQYLPIYYFCLADSDRELKKNQGFFMHLRMDENIREKIPFAWAPYADNPEYGNQLIKDLLGKNQLMVPAGGILAAQLQGNFTSPSENLYGIEALRYLLAGILVCPFQPVKKEVRRPPKDVSEVARLEISEIWKKVEEEEWLGD